jgi:hypothetical protein
MKPQTPVLIKQTTIGLLNTQIQILLQLSNEATTHRSTYFTILTCSARAIVIILRGRIFTNLKMFFKSYSYTIFYLQKNLKRLFQRICKNKQSGANVVQNVKLEESNHVCLEILSIVSFKITYAHLSNCKLVTFLHFIFALVCVGINHQKGGD